MSSAVNEIPDTNASASHRTGDAEEEETPSPDPTSKLVSKWYRHVCEYGSCPSRWSEFKHVDNDYKALIARTASVPIIHHFSDDSGKWVTTSITVQDVSMRKVLKDALKGYQNLDLDVKDYTFTPPFVRACCDP